MTISVKVLRTDTTNPLHVYDIVMEKDEGVWCESLATKQEVTAFFRGVRAAASMFSNLHVQVPSLMR